MGEIVLPPLIPIENYSEIEGKLAASVKWVITRVFESSANIPDKLRHGIVRDDTGRFHFDTAVLTGLTNGSLYSQAAAKIFKEPHLVNQSHGAVIAVLTDYGIDVVQRAEEGGHPVSEQELMSAEPFQKLAHLAVIDALMLAHLRNIVTVERVVESVSRQTSVDDRERPMDSADALLFWINKICLLVRDDVEQSQIILKGGDEGGMIPEMEDLYDEISDGQCLCALISYYRPRELPIDDVCFNDKMSNPDCQYNLMLIREFCRNFLPINLFHMEIEDLLYLHDTMQMNVNVLLADLFDILEPPPIVPQQPESVTSPRRFVPVHAIPDLRAANAAARSPHPPRVRNPFHNVQVAQTTPTRSMSVMSQDSLMANRSATWGRNMPKGTPEFSGNITNFGRLPQYDAGSNGNLSQTGQYTRSDSLPAASIRMALEEKRREHEKRKMMQNTMSESERAEKTKAAFFAVMNQAKQVPQSPDTKMLNDMSQRLAKMEEVFEQMRFQTTDQQQRMSRALSQPSVYQDGMLPQSARGDYSTLPHGGMPPPGYQQQPYDFYGTPQQQQQQMMQQSQYGMPNQMRSSLSNGMINYLPGQMPTDYGYNHQGMMQPQQGYQNGQHGLLQQQQQQQQPQQGFSLMHQSAHATTGFGMQMHQGGGQMGLPPMQHEVSPIYQQQQAAAQQYSDMGYGQPQQIPQSASYSYASTPVDAPARGFADMSDNMSMVSGYDGQDGGGNTFRLHSHDASSSRLDPPLELNRNLTNWGMTMKQGHTGRPQRRTWENQTFIKNEQDLVNHPDLVPNIPNGEDYSMPPQRRSPSTVGSIKRRSRDSRDDSLPAEKISDPGPPQLNHGSPPRDPGMSSHYNGNGMDSSRSSAPPAPTFVVDQTGDDSDKIAEQRREAKRAALLAKTQKRKEEMENKLDAVEQRNIEKKLAEEAKKEAVEQKKLEKEIQRQKILDDYKKKKMEKELGLEPSSARSVQSARGHSQPPFVRTKSHMTESSMGGVTDRSNTRPRGISNAEIKVASLQEPTHKLFAKTNPKSNRSLIINALQYAVFPGHVNKDQLMKAMNDLASSSSKHFLIHFRDHKCQYRGLYAWDQQSDTVEKISGQGPSKCTEEMIKIMFKYDSGGKSFSQIPTKHLGATIDGFAIQDSFWQKPKIPHSNAAAAHRNN